MFSPANCKWNLLATTRRAIKRKKNLNASFKRNEKNNRRAVGRSGVPHTSHKRQMHTRTFIKRLYTHRIHYVTCRLKFVFTA